ncbi:MAG TPA: tetratricopeptide repeat protein, partial [Terricaulis sp.]|nr:tetratricopeptide repeat protein [Terricaulis sp.]
MRGICLAICAGLALAACAPRAPDPLTEAARACAEAAGEAQIAGCTAIIDSAETDEAAKVEAYATRAAVRREAGDVTAALRDYEAALRLDDAYAGALLGRGEILYASGQLDAALPMVERAAPNDASG